MNRNFFLEKSSRLQTEGRRTQKTKLILSLIRWFNLRLGGCSVMEREYIMHHIRRRNLGLEHLIASMQLGKYSEDYSRRSKNSKPEQWIPEAVKST